MKYIRDMNVSSGWTYGALQYLHRTRDLGQIFPENISGLIVVLITSNHALLDVSLELRLRVYCALLPGVSGCRSRNPFAANACGVSYRRMYKTGFGIIQSTKSYR